MGQVSGSTGRSEIFAKEYLSRYADGDNSSPSNAKSAVQQSRLLQERYDASSSCCALPIASEASMSNASTGKPLRMDFFSLTDVNGEGVECKEVVRAICMVPPPITSLQDGVTTREGQDVLHVEHGRDDAEVNVRPAPSALEVPPDFHSTGYDWSAASPTSRPLTASQESKLESAMKPFVRSMMTGVIVALRLEAGEVPEGGSEPMGQSFSSVLTVSEDFSMLSIAAGSSERSVPIRAIRWVRPPENCRDQEKCVDLRLAGGRFVRFQFSTAAQANYFGTCMRLLVKASRTDPEALAGGAQAV